MNFDPFPGEEVWFHQVKRGEVTQAEGIASAKDSYIETEGDGGFQILGQGMEGCCPVCKDEYVLKIRCTTQCL